MNVREVVDEDIPELVALMSASLGAGSVPRSEAFFRWKHLENPFGRSGMWVATDGERIVGLRTMLRWEVARGARTMRLVRAVDTATHPDAQGKGVFRRLTLRSIQQLTNEGVAGVFNTPNEKSGAGYLKMGWRDLGRVHVLVRPSIGGLLARADGEEAWEVRTDECSRESLEDFATRLAQHDQAFRTPRTAAYLRWRYVDIPGIRYGATSGQAGLVVFRRRVRRGLREVTLCEAKLDGVRASSRLLREVASGADLVSCAKAFDPDTSNALRALGFFPIAGPTLFARPLADGGVTAVDDVAWSTGDLELF